ncbi:hypothetical protein ACET6Z_16485 [Aeromonas veronii]|uniref:Imm32 family immunity protein n=1 Tax=Aeromonas veronii TaxID=654 RepID=UPI0028DAAF34|nr:hypothetical protein [Aeromonas veronii]
MKLYGYKDDGLDIGEINPSELKEITLVASPIELRRIAAFLEQAAFEMDRMGDSYSHEHLSDNDDFFENSPQFVVASEW